MNNQKRGNTTTDVGHEFERVKGGVEFPTPNMIEKSRRRVSRDSCCPFMTGMTPFTLTLDGHPNLMDLIHLECLDKKKMEHLDSDSKFTRRL